MCLVAEHGRSVSVYAEDEQVAVRYRTSQMACRARLRVEEGRGVDRLDDRGDHACHRLSFPSLVCRSEARFAELSCIDEVDLITLTATVGAFGGAFSASQAESVGAPAPSRMRFYTLAQSLSPGACSAPTMVGLEDASGNRTLADASTAVDMSVPAGLTLYSDQFCNQAISNRLTIASGAMSASFYFKAPNAGTYTLTASSAGLGSDSQDEDVR